MKPQDKTRLQKYLGALNFVLNVPLTFSALTELAEIEREGHQLAEQYCNGDVSASEHSILENRLIRRVQRLVGDFEALHFNSDPRGHFLKIEDGYMRTQAQDSGLETDWGGYGILVPEWVCNLVDGED